jgi:hypothetical protein
LALVLTLFLAPGLGFAAEEEGATGEAAGVVSEVDASLRTLVLHSVVYTVPEDVSAFDLVEPGTPVYLEYREVGEELRVFFLRLPGA